MKKIMLNMNDLIKFIETNKNIDFKSDTERKRLKNMIEKYDYSNIFSLKYFLQLEEFQKSIMELRNTRLDMIRKLNIKILKNNI